MSGRTVRMVLMPNISGNARAREAREHDGRGAGHFLRRLHRRRRARARAVAAGIDTPAHFRRPARASRSRPAQGAYSDPVAFNVKAFEKLALSLDVAVGRRHQHAPRRPADQLVGGRRARRGRLRRPASSRCRRSRRSTPASGRSTGSRRSTCVARRPAGPSCCSATRSPTGAAARATTTGSCSPTSTSAGATCSRAAGRAPQQEKGGRQRRHRRQPRAQSRQRPLGARTGRARRARPRRRHACRVLRRHNDIAGDFTAAQIIAGTQQIIDKVHARGMKIIGVTVIPRGRPAPATGLDVGLRSAAAGAERLDTHTRRTSTA